MIGQRLRKLLAIRITLFSLLILLPVAATAQITFDRCTDALGRSVASVQASVNDIALATLYNGQPVILYNPFVVSSVSPQTRLFFYAHECGHHALGHALTGLRLNQEQEADCFGIVELVKRDLLNDDDVT